MKTPGNALAFLFLRRAANAQTIASGEGERRGTNWYP